MNAKDLIKQVKTVEGTDLYSLRSIVEVAQQHGGPFNYKSVRARMARTTALQKIGNDYGIEAKNLCAAFAFAMPDFSKLTLKAVELDSAAPSQQPESKAQLEQQAASYFAKDNTQGRAMVDATQPAYFRYYGPKGERRSPVQYAIEDAQIEQCGAVTNLYLACSLDLGKSAIYTADFIFNDDLYLALFAEHDWFYNLKNCTHLHASALPEFYLSVIRFARAYMDDYITTNEAHLATLLAEALAISELAPLDTYNGYSLDELMTKCENHYQKTVEAKLGKVANPDELRTSIDIKVAAYLDELTKDNKAAA